MATVLGTVLRVALVGAPHCDRAFDRKHPEWEKLSVRYARTRHPKDLEKLPLREGREPTLYGIAMLSAEGYQAISAEKNIARMFLLVRLGLVEIAHPGGLVEKPTKTEKQGDLTLAAMEWVHRLQAHGGVGLACEIGHLIERRAIIGDLEPDEDPTTGDLLDPLDLYGLPAGVALAL